MDFNLEEKLQELIQKDKIEEAIQIAEDELSKYDKTEFPQIIGKDLLHQIAELENYLETFISKLENRISLKSVYGEMNGFSINYDLWFVDFFGFELIGEMDDLDWLADWEDGNASMNPFLIRGFEEIQKIYQTHHEKEMYKYDEHEEAADTCDYVVILRLHQLFKATIKKGKSENKRWANIPILVTGHDYELIYRMN